MRRRPGPRRKFADRARNRPDVLGRGATAAADDVDEAARGELFQRGSGIRRMLVGSWVDLGLLFGVLFVMTVKPASGEVGALVLLAAIPVCFTVVPAVFLRMRARPTAQAVASTR